MGIKQSSRYCHFCQQDVLAQASSPNHILHLILSCLTAGVWVLVWISMIFLSIGGYRCSQCGRKV